MAAAPTAALGSRPTRNSISRKSSTRSRQASHRRRWSRAHSRSFPSSRSSSTALGEMRVHRLRSELDVVINLPQLGATAVERVHQLTGRDVDHFRDLLVGQLDEVAEKDDDACLEWQRGDRPLHGVAAQGSAGFGLWKAFEDQLIRTVPPEPAPRPQRLAAELGGRPEDIGAPQALSRRPIAYAV